MIELFIPLVLGWLLGWLVNYLADVLPATLKFSHPTCPNPQCRKPYPWGRYLFLQGCDQCGKKRGVRSYLTPLITIAIALYLWFHPPAKIQFTLGLLLFGYLLTVAIIDLEHRLILGPLSLAGLFLAAICGLLTNGWQETLIGGAVGFAIMYIFYLAGKLFSRLRARRLGLDNAEADEALGSGDVTLMTLLGLALGWPLIWFALLVGVLTAGLVSLLILLALLIQGRYRQQALNIFIPYGPFFIASSMLLIYFPQLVSALLPN